MTRDDIINLMKRDGSWDYFDLEGDSVGILMLVTLCQDVAAAEREACAKVCDGVVDAEYKTGKVDHNEMGWTQACAIAIRARSKT